VNKIVGFMLSCSSWMGDSCQLSELLFKAYTAYGES